jgi:hypothetical protein
MFANRDACLKYQMQACGQMHDPLILSNSKAVKELAQDGGNYTYASLYLLTGNSLHIAQPVSLFA